MRSTMAILGLLFIALCQPSLSQSTEGAASTAPAPAAAAPAAPAAPDTEPAEWVDVVYELHRPIELSCRPAGDADAPPGTYTWKANGTGVELVSSLAGRYELPEAEAGAAFRVARSTEEDWGNYTCLVHGVPARGFRVGAKPVLRLPSDSNVVEGQKLKLTCRVLGRPYPAVQWKYAAAAGENETDALEALGARAHAQASAAGVPGGELVLEAAERADAGLYSCHAPGAAPAATVLRVKDMYAALWPFLGICAEVFILCAIILVYEKRRTKPELDDSDTDNHEQKKS